MKFRRNGVVVLCVGVLAASSAAVARDRDEEKERESTTIRMPNGQKIERDDPRIRQKAIEERRESPETPQSQAKLLQIAREEAVRWAAKMPASNRPTPLAPLASAGESWVNMGPADALFEFNSVLYPQVDSGRLTGVLVDPTNTETVYVSTAGGGLWKTFNISDPNPTWLPTTETVGNLSIGAAEMDPENPQTIYLGYGDAFDKKGGQMIMSTDGARTWSAPVTLTGTAGGITVTATNIREIRVDPSNSARVLVGTDVGLFISTDTGTTYTLKALPNDTSAGGPAEVAESIWGIVFTGAASGQSHFAVSGVYACDAGLLPPAAGFGSFPSPACAFGNPGDIWVSTDSGSTFTSSLAAGTLPTPPPQYVAAGRIQLGAGSTSNASATVVYAQISSEDDFFGNGIWRSVNGGATFVDVSTPLVNPDGAADQNGGCQEIDVNQGQSWYNDTVAVDPQNSDSVILGGSVCGLRSINGTAAAPNWELVASWLPAAFEFGIGQTAAGVLPYVHADWHTSRIVRVGVGANSHYRVYVGSDGGLFYSDNAFSAPSPTDQTVTWVFANRGLSTMLGYSVASGDPADGNPTVAFFGLQDNGTRYRDANPVFPTAFDQVIGGDGIGTAVNTGTLGSIYWASSEFSHDFCAANDNTFVGNFDCNQPVNWFGSDPPTNPGSLPASVACGANEQEPFFVYYSAILSDATGMSALSITSNGVYRVTAVPTNPVGLVPAWKNLLCVPAGSAGSAVVHNVFASPTIAGLYGVAIAGGKFVVTNGCGNTPCTWTTSATRIGPQSAPTLAGTSMIAFPPVTPGGKTAGDVYIGASLGTALSDGTAIPDSVGHLFVTTDRGATFTPLHGPDTGAGSLPNVPVNVVRYDPSDSTDNVIYVGTDIGVYRSDDGGATWARFGSDLPMTKVNDIYLSRNGGMVRIATYGRGLWEVYPGSTAKGINGNGDFDRNQEIDFFDVNALAIRMGTNPGTTTQPYYDWNVDLVGTSDGIDDQDLTALLAKLGGTP